MTFPPPFPRIPLLAEAPGATTDDRVLDAVGRRAWFGTPVIVEEKLDGANVSIWLEEGEPRSAGRGGPAAMDRAGQFGRLRAWTAERRSQLLALLRPGEVFFGEWLYLQHSVRYDRLPDWLVVLDLLRDGQFFSVEERDNRCAQVGLATPPVLRRGVVASARDLEALAGPSRLGSEPMEGVVLRREHDGRLVDRVKWLRPGFRRIDDAAWDRGRPHNRVVDPALSLHDPAPPSPHR